MLLRYTRRALKCALEGVRRGAGGGGPGVPIKPFSTGPWKNVPGSNAPLFLGIGVASALGVWYAPSLYSDGPLVLRRDMDRMVGFPLVHEPHQVDTDDRNLGRKERRVYTREQVSQHTSKETGIWVIHEQGVYDITEFVAVHPGGDKILMAAGRSIDPFWAVFAIHKTKETRELLEQFRIGDLRDVPGQEVTDDGEALKGLFANEPVRDPALVVRSEFPCNAETPITALDQQTTPNPKFFVRNHLPVPDIKSGAYRLTVDGPSGSLSLSLPDLKEKFEKVSVAVTLQCAGNRRKEMHEVKPVNGLQWEQGAIGTAVWSGVRLRDVLKEMGYAPSEEIKHVQFHGAEGYGASIPIDKAVSATGDVILAYEMNGEDLPVDHGAPLRVVVPGHVAARSVKWVDRISLSDEESESHWQRKDYKGFSPSKNNVSEEDYEKATSIQELPVQSAIVSPAKNEVVDASSSVVPVTGYAVSGGGRGIVRVDVSGDGGRTWTDATLHRPNQSPSASWAWTIWEARVPVPKKGDKMEIVCKAIDESYNSQPEGMQGIWNVRGVLVNAWHKVAIKIHRKETDE
ncbi:uncharacterized protein SPPG_06649 [Spizellomyces punctatus DAOM BR117]|uniref:Nitrate reductase [NADPH] n=1 Tax=Spizellomyces punctatus (strain DAOM BR117) TaxID=645134 RepID=A0A0L0H9M1_SPIPD|nr:uncharacterized protein SPPG_06649 [Spizellomyces punctatus DAOM BR117]KNC98250.1 hypothetical protein SPPG_06649 [Spizellomyces punctatus DAOM BR117]|eukprot:XP_016606290.1 hypothetical protein SPPG_06649 [Spizellomyces punctatus DAOM BR117]